MPARTLQFCLIFLLSAPSLPAQQQIIRDIQYAAPNGHSLTLDVFAPKKQPQPAPVIVFVHGGGWKNGDKEERQKKCGVACR